jgi:di/tripeptidase
VPIAIIGTEGGNGHGADEWASLSSMDDLKKVLIAFLTQEAKRP